MAGTLGNVLQEKSGPGPSYIAIRVASLRLDKVTGFDVFIRPGPGQPYVLYAERHTPFREEARRRLDENRIQSVFIDASEHNAYITYLESNLPEILNDPSLPPVEKAAILYNSANQLMEEVFDDPWAAESLRRSRNLATNTVGFLYQEKTAFEHLIKAASYDYEIYSHSVNICAYAIAMAQRAGYRDQHTLSEIANGALLHDIGKTLIDRTIVDKPNRLTLSEWETVKQHTVLGEDMLRQTGKFGELSLSIVRSHHEKMDKSGYPDGISAKDLSPIVRMVTIVDAFDAMTTHRSYKKAVSTYEGIRTMVKDMSAELDVELLKLFIDLMGKPTRS